MSKPLTDHDVKQLLKLDAVDDVQNGRIVYSPDFRDQVVKRYLDGESPAEIFRSNGLDPSLIGRKRIERCVSRWTEGLPRHTIHTPSDADRPSYTELKKQLERARLENVMLKVELGRL